MSEKPLHKNQFESRSNPIQPKAKTKPVTEVVEEPTPPPAPKPEKKANPLAGKVKRKRDAKSYGFFLDNDVVAALEKLASKNKISTSQALNLLLRDLLLDEE